MTRSMTGYSRATSSEIDGLSWSVEIHSVNRKALDVHMHLSRELLSLDQELRKMITQVVHRGQVTVRISINKGKQTASSSVLLKKLKTEWEKTAKALGFSREEITLSFLLEQMDRVSIDEFSPKVQTELKKTVKKALDDFVKMKEIEGRALAADILKRIKTLSSNIQAIEKLSAKTPEKLRKKLLERLENLLEDAAQDERVFREIALFAERADVTEEITRLKSHFSQVAEVFKSKEKSVGRTLEFLTQEILREINTIASKSAELAITQMAIASKAELEKIREQVHNIE